MKHSWRCRSHAAHRAAATGLMVLLAANMLGADWKKAEAGWKYEFPRDHGVHREFKTEWWYFTGNLFDDEGRRFGYELTFFRHGIRPASEREPNASRFIVDDLKFAHFAMTDVSGQHFQFEQKMSRGAFGEAGFDDSVRLAWIDNWTLAANDDGTFDLAASGDAGALRLHLTAKKLPIVHGENGVSLKMADGSSASHYYSMPRLETTGEIKVAGRALPIRGESWFDHEWSSSQLGKGQVGWDWLCVQWEDGTELMLYRMRLEGGGVDPASSGSWIAADGTTTHLRASDFQMEPTSFWKSKKSGAVYPVSWRLEIAGQELIVSIRPALEGQELALAELTYWEGAIDVHGKRATSEITGRGYLELTGYASGSKSPGR